MDRKKRLAQIAYLERLMTKGLTGRAKKDAKRVKLAQAKIAKEIISGARPIEDYPFPAPKDDG